MTTITRDLTLVERDAAELRCNVERCRGYLTRLRSRETPATQVRRSPSAPTTMQVLRAVSEGTSVVLTDSGVPVGADAAAGCAGAVADHRPPGAARRRLGAAAVPVYDRRSVDAAREVSIDVLAPGRG